MPADTQNLVVEQGSTFSQVVNVSEGGSPKNLTGWIARAEIRRSKTNATILQAITATITDAANGEITLGITAADTASLNVVKGWWDLEIDDQGGTPIVIRLLEGSVAIKSNVTRG